MFKPGDRVGEIALRHFCVVKVGKRQGEDEAPSDAQDSEAALSAGVLVEDLQVSEPKKGKSDWM